ncbi:substrate-binding domain-containing protein [Paenibacillus xylanexedens]|uniref:substrate-binding domain-containing protein n=1 Tax=Paenibacillus xylanexedens TaxID=528191 RepID=UPI0011A33A32|nr:substrate-binding domain-containing protein [Paenibacillus xylanexedens]
MDKKKKVTMQEIADRVGVSKYAVSKALSGKAGISTATRERIFEVASNLGYLDQQLTRRTMAPKTQAEEEERMIGILFPNIRSQNRESFYWGRVLEGVFRGLEEHGISSVLITDDSPHNFNKLMRPEALLGIIGIGLIDTAMLVELRSLGIPFVIIDHEDELVASDTVFMNNYDIYRKLTKFLIGKGHRHIQFVGDWSYARSFADRWSGFKAILDENGIPYAPHKELLQIRPTHHHDNLELIRTAMQQLSENSSTTAIVCANDKVASLCMAELERQGKRIPADISVVAFDNDPDVQAQYPELCTVNAETEALGVQAVEIMQWRLKHIAMPYEKRLIQGELIIKGSIDSLV